MNIENNINELIEEDPLLTLPEVINDEIPKLN